MIYWTFQLGQAQAARSLLHVDPRSLPALSLSIEVGQFSTRQKLGYGCLMPILKNADRPIIDERKIRDYLLNPNHAVGGHKARVVQAAIGLTRVHYRSLIEQIRQGIMIHEAEPHGDYKGQPLFRVHVPVMGARGTATLRTGWIYEEDSDAPRLTTAYIVRT